MEDSRKYMKSIYYVFIDDIDKTLSNRPRCSKAKQFVMHRRLLLFIGNIARFGEV